MNIGIDLDDTINDLHKILVVKAMEFNKKNNIDFIVNPNEWDWDKACGWNDQNGIDFFIENGEELCLEAPIKQHVTEIINRLYSEGHRIIIITSRSKKELKDPYKTSKIWLDKNGIKYHELIVEAKEKATLCVNKKIEVFIDDLPWYCEEVANKHIKVLMFDSPYNQKETRFKRVYSWKDVYNEINKIKTN